MKPRVSVVTHSPSPYQVELFDAVAASQGIDLSVVYLYGADPARSWGRRRPAHAHRVVSESGGASMSPAMELSPDEEGADLSVFNWYRHPLATRWIQQRVAAGTPWAFWGERPGFRHPWLGRLARRWYLRGLHRAQAPIWGIGGFALDEYRREFGAQCQYVNLPYFSDLARFSVPDGSRNGGKERVVLFSGALIPRKGVDLLARAFLQVAARHSNLRLLLLGTGPLEAELRRTLAPMGHQVSFLGFRDWDDLPSVYASANVLCVPSRYDGWGLVVPEGLAAGLPVIATDRMGAALDLVQDGENGWVIPAGDVRALADALEKAARLPGDSISEMSISACQSVAHHGLAHGAERFLNACRGAIAHWA